MVMSSLCLPQGLRCLISAQVSDFILHGEEGLAPGRELPQFARDLAGGACKLGVPLRALFAACRDKLSAICGIGIDKLFLLSGLSLIAGGQLFLLQFGADPFRNL